MPTNQPVNPKFVFAASTKNIALNLGLKVSLSSLLLTLFSCTITPEPVVTALPPVSADAAATITVRSRENPTDVKHHHLLMIDGIVAGKFKEDDVNAYEISAGMHKLNLTCHSRNQGGDNVFPFNFRVADGRAELDIDVSAGDSICLKISFNPLNCAILHEAGPSYCQ